MAKSEFMACCEVLDQIEKVLSKVVSLARTPQKTIVTSNGYVVIVEKNK